MQKPQNKEDKQRERLMYTNKESDNHLLMAQKQKYKQTENQQKVLADDSKKKKRKTEINIK